MLLLLLFLCSSLHAAPFFIGIAGGSGSGKTTLASSLHEALQGRSLLIHMDDYYRDLSHLSDEEISITNFDHPAALDFDLIYSHLSLLKEGCPYYPPSYDFLTHTSVPVASPQAPAEIIIVEGILLFTTPGICSLFDLKIFVDTDPDVRLLRRVERDIRERGLTLSAVHAQYLASVKPMHELFVEPTRQYADLIIPHGGQNPRILSLLLSACP